ncbi:MAG TPA: signal peptidase I [Candidatus Saccharimonadia bacterium]|jgi:signal peptidase I|nr:signal peptidase I [Candidatus Saccharimonadia bacterium]
MDNPNQTPTPGSGPGTPASAPGGLPNSPLGHANSSAAATSSKPATPVASNPLETPPAGEPSPTGTAINSIAHGFSAVFAAIFSWIVFPIAVVLILHNFVFQAYHVVGTSMVPTLHDTDYLIISKLGYTQALVERLFGQDKKYIPPRGQVIVFRFPKDTSRVFVKRVVGLPGDRVVIKNGSVTIFNASHPNGFNPDLGYEAKDTSTLIDTDEVVQQGNVFVMGDNRTPNGSYDSREWGELPSSYIIGNAVLRLLPLDQVKVL